MNRKFIQIVVCISSLFLILQLFTNNISYANATDNNEKIIISDLKNLDKLINFSEIEGTFDLSSKKFISAKKLESKRYIVGIIDFYDESKKTNYTLFVNPDRKIEVIATEKMVGDKDVEIDLYTWHNKYLELKYKGIINKNTQILKDLPIYQDRMSEDTWKLLVNWACSFSSFLACKSVGYAVGASGVLDGVVLGGLTIGAGFLVGQACSFVFTTLVNRYGGKDAACGFIKSGKATWDYFH